MWSVGRKEGLISAWEDKLGGEGQRKQVSKFVRALILLRFLRAASSQQKLDPLTMTCLEDVCSPEGED